MKRNPRPVAPFPVVLISHGPITEFATARQGVPAKDHHSTVPGAITIMKVPEATKTTLRVLLVQHSLSGETNTATHEFLRGMKDGIEHDDCWPNRRFELVEQRIETEPPFSFPWNVWSFFDVMAETVAPSVRIKSKHWTVKEPNVAVDVSRADDNGLVLVDEPS
jgi:hypothetical protein